MSEIRRSSRANKGTNSRLEDQIKYEELMAAASQSRTRSTSDEDEDQDDDGSVLCLVCGTTDENYDEEKDQRDMIQCDGCQTWQHTECIFGKKLNNIPNEYKCNVCDPHNESYKNLSYKIDPATIKLGNKKSKSKSKSKTKKKPVKKIRTNSSGSQDNQDDDDDDFKDKERDNDDDDADFSADDAEFKVKSERSSLDKKRSRSTSKSTDETHLTKRRNSAKSPKAVDPKAKDIELKTKEAVKKRFQTMFLKLLPGSTVNLNEGEDKNETVESISLKWATKLEDELFKVYHDPETLKLPPSYKEASARIYSNVIDVKNSKLRNSIINKKLPFDKLVRMPVQELLNPDLRKEKEEAIKESMTLATLEAPTVSNIRRTHKGDILLEKEDSNQGNQQFDFNVGMNIDNDEKKFTKSENTVIIERKESSIYNNATSNHNEDEDEDNNNNNGNNGFDNSFENDYDGEQQNNDEENSRDRSHSLQDDDAILQILGETEQEVKLQEKDDSSLFNFQQTIWSGQTVFVGVTNFASEAKLSATNLKFTDYEKLIENLIDHDLPLEIEGRLDLRKADDYIKKISDSRKLILLELCNSESNEKNFHKLFDYFYSRKKVGVVKFKQNFIKDAYIISTKDDNSPKFFSTVLKKTDISEEPRLYLVFVVKQELIRDNASLESSRRTSSITAHNNQQNHSENNLSAVPSFEFLSRLNPHELDLVNKIFDERPETRVDVNLLVTYLQQKLKHQSQ